MALTKRSDSQTVYLEVKFYSLWRSLKTQTPDCEAIEVTNPRSGEKSTKFGHKFDTVSGRAIKLTKYDTEKKYPTRYFGFNLFLVEGAETYVVKMPYDSQILRRFLRVARNLDFNKSFSITVFKGKSKDGKIGSEQTGIWFKQNGETVKPYYSKEQSHGMPEATFDDLEQKWSFKEQHRWLVQRLQSETIPDIEAAAARVAPPLEPETNHEEPSLEDEGPEPAWEKDHITDEDLPF